MLTTHRAPMEVVRLALEIAYLTPNHTLWDDYGHRIRVAWFASTLRVSRTWYIAGQRALYHRIYLVTQHEQSISLLTRTLSQKPYIAQMVKAVHIQTLDQGDRRFRRRHESRFHSASIPQKKLTQMLVLCEGVIELTLEEPDLAALIPTLDCKRFGLQRLVIQRAHQVPQDHWERLARSTFWRNLRDIRLDASHLEWTRLLPEGLYNFDVAFIGAEPFARLEGQSHIHSIAQSAGGNSYLRTLPR